RGAQVHRLERPSARHRLRQREDSRDQAQSRPAEEHLAGRPALGRTRHARARARRRDVRGALRPPSPEEDRARDLPRVPARRAACGAGSAGIPSELRQGGRHAVSFPRGFIWGTATAAHQVEGGNWNNDWWAWEHAPGTPCAEPSADACDHYHRYREDVALLASLGFNAYRFSLEWSRIEPEHGHFSRAQLDHYRRMCAACLEHGVAPIVTFHHFTTPRWGGGARRLDRARHRRAVRPILRAGPGAPGRSDRPQLHV